MPSRIVRKEDIIRGLREAGIEPGDSVMVHSSLSSMGWVEGGPDAVIDAFLELLGNEGTMMVPTFPSGEALPEVFDPRTVPSACGRITEAFRRRPEAVRSLDPWHSVAAIGAHALFYIENHINTTTIGIDSPLDRCARNGGKVVLLGVGHNRNTTIHLGELRAPVPHLHIPYNEEYAKPRKVLLPDGSIFEKQPDEMPGCSENFGVLEPIFRERGLIAESRIGEAVVQVMPAMEIIQTVAECLRREPYMLLCNRPDCCYCPRVRAELGVK